MIHLGDGSFKLSCMDDRISVDVGYGRKMLKIGEIIFRLLSFGSEQGDQ